MIIALGGSYNRVPCGHPIGSYKRLPCGHSVGSYNRVPSHGHPIGS